MKKERIKITREGYEDLLRQIAEKEKEFNEINSGRREAWDAGAGDGWDSPEMERIEMLSRGAERELVELRYKLANCEIVERQEENASIVDIGDVVLVEIQFDEDDKEESKIRLVADFMGHEGADGIDRVSIDSPLGKAIYGQKVGEPYPYHVNGNTFIVHVKEKIAEKTSEPEAPQKQ